MPTLLPYTTALRIRPLTLMSTSTGAMTLSRSQMSWCTDWKCHLRSPVLASMATIELANRLSPPRAEPSRRG